MKQSGFMKQSGRRLGQYVAFHNTPEQYDSILIASATLTEPSITAEGTSDYSLTDFRLQPVNCGIQVHRTQITTFHTISHRNRASFSVSFPDHKHIGHQLQLCVANLGS
jgi:hypothetical protein